jgi:ATP-dependent DNA ligase
MMGTSAAYRFICRREGERVRVFSRHGRDWTDRVPLIAEALLALRARSVTLDGEGVVCDELGVSDFERLRSALARGGSWVTFLYAFDLLELDGQDLRAHPWDDRRVAMARLLPDGLRLSPQRCSSMSAPWDWKASSRSAGIGRTARVDAPRKGPLPPGGPLF